MGRNQRDEPTTASFTITNSEVTTSLDADTTTATIQNNAIAAIMQELQNQGIMKGDIS